MSKPDIPIFDGHNDVLLRLFQAGGRGHADSFVTGRDGHIDLKKAKSGGLAGGFFAIYVPSHVDLDLKFELMTQDSYYLPLPPAIDLADALPIALQQAAILAELETLGALKICTSVNEIQTCIKDGVMAAIMHMEGAEAIDADLYNLDVFYRAGLRSLGPVWSRPTIFGEGVPFRFPSTGDIGGGLSEHGIRLVKRCDELGIMLDMSHLNEAGFWDIAKHSTKPLVATHSNSHVLSPHARNLTDRQLAAIAESDGMVGLNFAVAFLRADGKMLADVHYDVMLRQLDHLIEHLGEDRVGLGSDFDGAVIPEDMGDCAGLATFRDAMHAHGYNDTLMMKLCHENWMRLLANNMG
jgi:membrane dipeptidase